MSDCNGLPVPSSRQPFNGSFDERLDWLERETTSGYWNWDLVEGRLSCSPNALRLLGLDPGQQPMAIEAVSALIHEDDRAPLMYAADPTNRAARVGIQFRLSEPNTPLRWFLLSGDVVREPGGRPLRIHAILVDITDLKLATLEREQLLASREALVRVARRFAGETNPERLLTDLVAEAVNVLKGDDGALMRWDQERQVLMPVRNTIPEASGFPSFPAGQGVSGRAALTRRPAILNDYPLQTIGETTGGLLGIQAAVAAPLLHEGVLLGTISVVVRRSGRQFGQADAELLELLASMGAAEMAGVEKARLEGALLAARTAQHELNNQLAITTGYADLLLNDPGLPPTARSAAQSILAGVEAAVRTVATLQRITRIHERHWGPAVPTTIDLAASSD